MNLRNPSIRTKLTGFAVAAIVVLLIPAAAILLGLSHAVDSIARVKPAHEAVRMIMAVQQSTAQMEAALPANAQTGGQANPEQFKAGERAAQDALKKLSGLVSGNPVQEKRVQEAQAVLSKWLKVAESAVTSRGGSKASGAPTRGTASAPDSMNTEGFVKLQTIMLGLIDGQLTGADLHLDRATEALHRMRIGPYAGVPIYGAILLLGALLVAGRVSSRIRAATQLAEAISRGELSHRLDVKGLDEAGKLGAALNTMADSLVKYNRQVLDGVGVLTESVSHIAGAASEFSVSSTQTASAVSETTTTVNEMEKTAKTINETSRRVADRSRQSDEIADTGIRATRDTVDKMNLIKGKMEIVSTAVLGLSDNTKNVESIISAVQDLADQSNLLAVNASIEAARAGEHGKGFAVVAHEIKTLADQSREATQRVTKILQEIRKSVGSVVMATEEGGKAVQGGVEQSEAAGESIQKLAGTLAEFTQAAGVIFSSTGKQFARVERVATAMKNVELALTQGVAGTTHLEKEARKLGELAHSLQGLVEQYKAQRQS